jgi:hypothetical protein
MLRTGTNQSERIKTRIGYEVDRTDIIRNFQNQSKQGTVFLNRLSGVRLSPGPPLLLIQFHEVDSSRPNSKHALKQYSVIKVSYFLHVIFANASGPYVATTFFGGPDTITRASLLDHTGCKSLCREESDVHSGNVTHRPFEARKEMNYIWVRFA